MLEASILPGIMLSISILLVHITSTSEFKKLNYIIAIISSGLISFVFNPSITYTTISMCLLFFVMICDKVETRSIVNYSILIAAFSAGKWVSPGLVEVVIVVAIVGLFIVENQKDILKIMPLLAMLVSLVALSIIFQNKNSEILLVTCAVISTFYYGLFWLSRNHGSAISNASLFIISGFYKFFLDQHLIDLTTRHSSIITNLISALLVLTNLFVVYCGVASRNYWQAFYQLVMLNLVFTTTGLYVEGSFELNHVLAVLVVFVGCGLVLPMTKHPKNKDKFIALIVGIIVIFSQLFYLKSHMLGLPILYILILNLASQVYFLMKIVRDCSKSRQVIVKTGERLPQFIYIGGVFGAIASLWYILIYVRQIQG